MQLSLISLALTKVYGGVAAFSPSSLFASGEQGAWYDPSDLTTMFQDSAGTTPVTADGQPVGKILDKSGRGNHATQATAASRPLYKTDGTYHWLQFDGVDDSLSTAAIDFTSTDKVTCFIGLDESKGGSARSCVICGVGDYNSINASFQFDNPNWTGESAVKTRGTQISGRVFSAITAKSVLTIQNDLAGASWELSNKLRSNGTALSGLNSNNETTGGGTFGNGPLYIADNPATTPFGGNIYPIVVLGRTATTQEITATETWVNQRTGAY